jgi:hypothetical protein
MNEIEPEVASQENTTNTGQVRKTKRTKTTWSPFERVTVLRGQSFSWPQESKSIRRSRTPLDIYGKDAGIPYIKFEAIARDLFCSLMERQDRMNEEIFARLNDLAHRLEDLEQDRQEDSGAK